MMQVRLVGTIPNVTLVAVIITYLRVFLSLVFIRRGPGFLGLIVQEISSVNQKIATRGRVSVIKKENIDR